MTKEEKLKQIESQLQTIKEETARAQEEFKLVKKLLELVLLENKKNYLFLDKGRNFGLRFMLLK